MRVLVDCLRPAMRGLTNLASLTVIALFVSSALLAPAAALADSHTSQAAPPLRVFAAASLTEVVEALTQSFDGGEVLTSFGASSDLARQIEDGAPADVFISASREWVDFLDETKATKGARVVVARNALVCIAPKASPLAKAGVTDPRTLRAKLAPGDLVAIADAGAPAGEYARAALEELGEAAAFEPRLVGQKDVRAVLHAVEQGEAAAGFVYATDAKLAKVETLFAFDPATHPPIEYHAVVVRQTANGDLAQRFLAYLSGEAARARLSMAGFVLP